MKLDNFVESCFEKYTALNLEPGNPLDGDWHKAHHPVPRHLGGTQMVWLLKEDHAIHGLLQSEEFCSPCLCGWDWKLLPDELKEPARKWLKAAGKLGGIKSTPKLKARSLDERSRIAGIAGKVGGKIGGPKGGKTQGLRNSESGHCQRIAGQGGKVSANNRWICLVTGHISNAGGLTRWQVKRGIDTAQRARYES